MVEEVKVSELPLAESLVGLKTLGLDSNNKSVSVPLTWLKEASDDLSRLKTESEKATGNATDAAGAANKAAKDAAAQMSQISQDASQMVTDVRQLEATVSGNEETRENFYSQVQAKEQARQNDETKRQEAAKAQADAEADRVLKDAERNRIFNDKLDEFANAAGEAQEQGTYAKTQADRAALYAERLEAVESGKVDGGYSEEGMLYLTSDGQVVGDPIPVGTGSGGGGGTAGIVMKVRALSDTLLTTIAGATLRIGYSFTSVYQDDQSETGDGTAIYTINSQKVATLPISQGDVYFDVSKWLIIGNNKIKVSVQDSTGQSRSLAFTVDVISLSISDNYNDAQINTGAITYRYTPVGAVEKTIHFVLDGIALDPVVTSISNRQQTYTISAQTHGAHILQVYITVLINGTEVRSNSLYHSIICIEEGNNSIIIASPFHSTQAKQYDNLAIPFVVYNPVAINSVAKLYINDELLSEQTVDRTLQIWNYRIISQQELHLKIESGNVIKELTPITVEAADVVVDAETADLSLHLTAANRSNKDNNKDEWKFGEISSLLTGFNYKTNGWITVNGSTVLRVSGDARVSIPYQIFANDFRNNGKTIEFEFETRDVIDYDAVVIDCLSGGIGLQMTAQQALFKSEQTTVSTRYKEDEHVRVSFVIEKKSDHRLIYIYINGIMSGVAQYPTDDNFQQATPVNIVIGSNDCTIDLYNIRIYDNNLTEYQMLDNFIADIDDYDKKVEVYERNQVYDEYGNISYQKVLEKIPCMILEGPLPTFKGDKKSNKIYFNNLQEPARSFSCENIENNVQGTSSQYYPRKNFKFKFKTPITYTASGDTSDNYALRADSIPANCYCIKADFAESSGTHNTGMAKIIDKLLKDMDILTPPQKENSHVRTTVDGYPICLFHRETADGELTFVGKYNFNNDKSTEHTFGFTEGDESWEFSNNTSDRCLFKSADFSTDDWQNDFEGRYPDGNTDTTNLQSIMEWVVSTKDNPAKFKAEVTEHFDLDNLLAYYIITELFAMVDQRAKNMFLTRYHGDKWRFIFYDNDTIAGVNNEGLIAFGYGVEYHDTEGTLNVFNGESSVLWNNVEAAFPNEIAAMYKNIRSKGYLSYDYVISILNGDESDKWCEAIYNADGRFKYVEPLIQDGNGSYLYAAQGSRAEHRKWWLYNRFLYMDSKYTAGDFLSDFATMRLYTPQSWAGVAPNADFTIVPFADQYVMVKYGSYMVGQRGKKGVSVTIKAPEIVFNDTETIIYGASRVKSLGDLAGKYAGTVDMSKAVRLSELQIGSDAAGYHNDNLTVLSIGSNKMLARLNIQNCPSLIQAIDLSSCDNIEEVYAQGAGITSVVLPAAGILTKLYLPETITNLTLKNQPKLSTYFNVSGVRMLTTIIYENTNVDIMSVVDRCFEVKNPALNRVRLIGIDSSGASLSALAKLTKVGGIDDLGNNTSLAIVTGKYYAEEAAEDKLAAVRAAFPDLTVTYTTLKPPTITTFTFTSSQSKTITNASFTCNFEYVKVNEYTYQVTADDDEVIEFTFKCDNHEDYTDSYVVAGTRSQSYKITYIPLRKIRVQVYGQSIYPQNARLTIGDQVYVSDQDGYVNIRSGAAIEGKVTAAGYSGSDFSFTAITNDTNHTIYVYVTVEVKFIVKNQLGVLVQGATIECNEKSGATNQYGECILLIGKGVYEYKVTHGSLNDYAGSITVSTSAMTVNVPLIDIEPLYFKPEENGNIQMMLMSSAVALTIASTTTGYVINWGDGTETSAAEIGQQRYNHTYSNNDFHQVEVYNCSDITSCFVVDVKTLVAYWSIGTSKVKDIRFNSCQSLIYFGNLFKNDIDRTDVSLLFYACGNLTTVDLTPLSGLLNVTTAENFLYDCKKITTIDLRPLLGWINIVNTQGLLKNCEKLTNIDLIPLSGWVKVKYANYLLAGCKNLISVDLTPLSGWVNTTSAYGLLNGCGALTSVDLSPLSSWVNVTDAREFLRDCGILTSVDLTPLSNWINVTHASGLLYGCGALTSVDLSPLSSWVNVTNAYCLLMRCSRLATIDLTPLSGWVNVTEVYSMFYSCSSLTAIDLGPLSSWIKVKDVSSMFQYCSRLTTIDLTPLSGWVNVIKSYSMLSFCERLTTIDLTPLSSWVNVTDASSILYGCRSLTSVDLTPLSGWVNMTNARGLFRECLRLNTIDLTPVSKWTKMTNNSELISACSKLIHIFINSDIPFALTNGALTTGNSCPIYVPDEAVDTYKTATNWTAYASRIKPMSDFSTDFPDEV